MAGIYVHIPFCARKCTYCDFYSIVRSGQQEQVLETIKAELGGERGFIGDLRVDSIYIGGGTPSLFTPGQLQGIIERVRSLWFLSGYAEITVEANPEDLGPAYLEELAATDVNRLSIGIQSFFDRDLRFMNRRHDARQAETAVRDAQRAGFGNISIDLIYGLPELSDGDWSENLRKAVDLDVQHISAYHLTVEEGTPLHGLMQTGRFRPVPEEGSERQYTILHDYLTRFGYEHYEVSNFARPGFRAVHNSSYWQGAEYLGVGPSAHSYNGHTRRSCVKSVDMYVEYSRSDNLYTTEHLSATNQYNEHIMTSLRCIEGISFDTLRARFGDERARRFEREARRFINDGLMECSEGRYYIPAEKFLLSDHVIAGLFE